MGVIKVFYVPTKHSGRIVISLYLIQINENNEVINILLPVTLFVLMFETST